MLDILLHEEEGKEDAEVTIIIVGCREDETKEITREGLFGVRHFTRCLLSFTGIDLVVSLSSSVLFRGDSLHCSVSRCLYSFNLSWVTAKKHKECLFFLFLLFFRALLLYSYD